VPALRSLRAAFPEAKITWLGLPGTEWFGQRFHHLLDHWLPFPGFPGIPEGWQGAQATVTFLQQVQAQPFDLTLQIHGNGRYINPFLTLLGGNLSAGFYVPGHYCPNPTTFLPYPEQVSEVERLRQLMLFLGLSEAQPALEFPIHEIEYRAGIRLLDAHSLEPGKYICLHPGASSSDRCWSITGFIHVARQLADQGYRIVLTGTSAERHLANQVIQALDHPCSALPLNLTGRTSLGGAAVLLNYAALLICNDTGISHLAAALTVPSVVVFSNSQVQRWAPGDRDRHRIVDSRLLGEATVEAVLAHAQDLLQPSVQSCSQRLLEDHHAG
jgi:ADP-heptose:LPS heptosyltransferase